MHLPNRPGNRQAQPKAAESVRSVLPGMVALGKGLEYPSKLVGGKADAGVGDTDPQFTAFRNRAALHRDSSPPWRELHGVLQHVPEHLLEPDRVAMNGVILRLEVEHQVDALLQRVGAHN